ncbi:MAG: hypothetical protein AAFR96_01310 [Planctomycetota bacterium]
MTTHDFDESLGTNADPLAPEGGVFTPALAKIQAGAGDAAASATPAHRSATKQYLLVGGVVAAGIGVLVFLRMQGVGADLLNADEPTIDYPLDAAVNVNTEQRQTEVLDALANSNIVAQVPSEQIEKNPFFLQSITSSGETIAEAGAAPEPVAPTGPTPEEIRLEELDRLAATLELNTVISGRISLARINGKTYRIGDTIAGEFRVMAINPDRTVEIKADQTTYVLEMTSR